jgi:hypothetical protein
MSSCTFLIHYRGTQHMAIAWHPLSSNQHIMCSVLWNFFLFLCSEGQHRYGFFTTYSKPNGCTTIQRISWDSARALCNFVSIIVTSLNLLHFNSILRFGKWKKSHGALIWWVGWVHNDSHIVLARNSCTDKAERAGALSWWRNQSPNSIFQVDFTPHFSTDATRCWFTVFAYGKNSQCTTPWTPKKKTMSMLFTFEWTCLAFFRCGDDWLFHWDYCCLVSGSQT